MVVGGEVVHLDLQVGRQIEGVHRAQDVLALVQVQEERSVVPQLHLLIKQLYRLHRLEPQVQQLQANQRLRVRYLLPRIL